VCVCVCVRACVRACVRVCVCVAGWQVTLCDLISHVSSCSGEASYKLLYPITTKTRYIIMPVLWLCPKVSLLFYVNYTQLVNASGWSLPHFSPMTTGQAACRESGSIEPERL